MFSSGKKKYKTIPANIVNEKTPKAKFKLGVTIAVKKSKAKIVYIMNMMTKSGQTTNYKASDHVSDLVKYLGREPDVVLINNGEISSDILLSYERYNEVKVVNDLNKNGYQIIEKDFLKELRYSGINIYFSK